MWKYRPLQTEESAEKHLLYQLYYTYPASNQRPLTGRSECLSRTFRPSAYCTLVLAALAILRTQRWPPPSVHCSETLVSGCPWPLLCCAPPGKMVTSTSIWFLHIKTWSWATNPGKWRTHCFLSIMNSKPQILRRHSTLLWCYQAPLATSYLFHIDFFWNLTIYNGFITI